MSSHPYELYSNKSRGNERNLAEKDWYHKNCLFGKREYNINKKRKRREKLYSTKTFLHSSKIYQTIIFLFTPVSRDWINRFFIVLLCFILHLPSWTYTQKIHFSPYAFHSKLQNVISGYLLFVFQALYIQVLHRFL